MRRSSTSQGRTGFPATRSGTAPSSTHATRPLTSTSRASREARRTSRERANRYVAASATSTAGAATRSEGAATDSSDCVRSGPSTVAARAAAQAAYPAKGRSTSEWRQPGPARQPAARRPPRDGGQDGESESDRAERLRGQMGPQPTPAGQVDRSDAPAGGSDAGREQGRGAEQRLGGDQAGTQEEREPTRGHQQGGDQREREVGGERRGHGEPGQRDGALELDHEPALGLPDEVVHLVADAQVLGVRPRQPAARRALPRCGGSGPRPRAGCRRRPRPR